MINDYLTHLWDDWKDKVLRQASQEVGAHLSHTDREMSQEEPRRTQSCVLLAIMQGVVPLDTRAAAVSQDCFVVFLPLFL